ncbi:MBL fold metallo-hydrolase [Robbsia sp. Bb-Pol-6]|uniref:MBL fold metallo-hydrolase n=1 Tax=Robbsia betulipollinis TaxID=2981849 RepID=A0ABT3ZLH4_9BURK|nr:MBL fold metallo-hydrolase [Robbsia betulipollinis]MCY0387396.1 MBL fold metallo-hydrolase [Robbsia betulipollinis]
MPTPTAARVEPFYDAVTATISYVLWDAVGGECAIIDSVLDYDPRAARLSTAAADRIVAFVVAHRLQTRWLLETHAHADHLSAAPYLRRRLGGRIAIGAGICAVQDAFSKVFNLEPGFRLDGSQFDHLFRDNEIFYIGSLRMRTMPVPGHTPADVAYLHERDDGETPLAFIGDTLFMPDVGSARCDFPGGDARMLYRSAQKILALPDATRLFMCHDYPPADREVRWETTVAAQRQGNIHLHAGVGEAYFVTLRESRDGTLPMPVLLLPAIQVNIRAGELPPAEDNGIRYLKIPVAGIPVAER